MARLRYNGLSTTLGGSGLASGATTSVTFGAALTYNGGTAVPTISSPDYIPLSILDSTGKLAEIVYLTAYTSGGTTGTITRAQEGTSAAARASGLKVVQSPTIRDVPRGFTSVTIAGASDLVLNQTAITAVASASPLSSASALDLTLAADVDDVIEVGINAYHQAATAQLVTLDVYTMVSGSRVNPFGVGLVSGAGTLLGIAGWIGSGVSGPAMPIGAPVFKTMVSGDLSSGTVTLRPHYAKSTTTARNLSASSNGPLIFWARNLGPLERS